MNDLFSAADDSENKKEKTKPQIGSNIPELSVSDLAGSLKRTLEETYGRIRVRGELAGLKLAGSGHLYGDIKDADANINIICWKGTMSKMALKPEEGMDVLITGKVSSYAKSSRYQIIIEKMELAGEGALLKMLEERKKKLAAEGLFDPSIKKQLPFLPQRIGVVTSPTGAVIQDILHRLKDRFPRHVLLWPVKVQGEGAASQIAQAIGGFNQLPDNLKPDLLILARGGGSLEDLMCFNEENVVRAVFQSNIPIITAVGHETDTTLVDYAADLRAPTPTGAAEMAVPVRLNLISQIQDNFQRLLQASKRIIGDRQNSLETQKAKLGTPSHLLETKAQTLDILSEKLGGSLRANISEKKSVLQSVASKIYNPTQSVDQKSQTLIYLHDRLIKILPRALLSKHDQLNGLSRMLESLSHKSVLKRGFTLIKDKNGQLIRKSSDFYDKQLVSVEFAENDKANITINTQKTS